MLEGFPETIQIGDQNFIVFVEGCKPRWFKCGGIWHAREKWKPLREESEEEVEEEKEKEMTKDAESSNPERETI